MTYDRIARAMPGGNHNAISIKNRINSIRKKRIQRREGGHLQQAIGNVAGNRPRMETDERHARDDTEPVKVKMELDAERREKRALNNHFQKLEEKDGRVVYMIKEETDFEADEMRAIEKETIEYRRRMIKHEENDDHLFEY